MIAPMGVQSRLVQLVAHHQLRAANMALNDQIRLALNAILWEDAILTCNILSIYRVIRPEISKDIRPLWKRA